jgi:hypothetical protein
MGCRDGFLSRKVYVVLWLFLFKGGEVLEAFWGNFGLDGVWWGPGQNWPDQFAKPI